MKLVVTEQVRKVIAELTAGRRRDESKAKKVRKTLRLLEQDPHHPGLTTHRFASLDELFDERIWESYVENRTPSAWRIWWYFGPDDETITVVALGPHP